MIMTYTLYSLSSLTKITHNLHVKINLKGKKWVKKKETQKLKHPLSLLVPVEGAYVSLQFIWYLTNTLDWNKATHIAITAKPEEDKEK